MTAQPTDWWYVRAYPGEPAAVDAASRMLVPWLRAQAQRLGAPRWFFMRYLDMTGHHLRLRLQCWPAQADELHQLSGELTDLMHQLDGDAGPGLLTSPALPAARGAVKVRHDLYAPELAKYGGADGVRIAEDLFTASSELYAEQDIAALPPRYQRAALAVGYLGGVVRQALGSDAQQWFWESHRRQWGWHVRMALPAPDRLSTEVGRIAEGIVATPSPPPAVTEAVALHGSRVVEALDRAEAAGVTVPRATLLLHYVHMDLNRWGLHPAEEFLLGVVTAYRKENDAHR